MQNQQQKPKLNDILQEYQDYKKAKVPPKKLFDRKIEKLSYEDKRDEGENSSILRFIFKKIDENNNGYIGKSELVREIASNQELADMLGIMGNIQDKEFVRQIDKIFQSLGSTDTIIERDFIQLFSKTRANNLNIAREQQQQIKPNFKPKTQSNTFPSVVLTDAQKDLLDYIFKNTDTFDDLAIQKYVYIQTLRTDENVIKILNADAVQLSPNLCLTLEQVLDYIENDGDPYENFTFNQFYEYFFKIPKGDYIKQDIFDKLQAIPEEEPKPTIILDELYLQIIQDVFDTLPRRGTDKVSTEEFINALLEDPQVQEFLKIKAREDPKTKKCESVEEVLKNIDKQAGVVIL